MRHGKLFAGAFILLLACLSGLSQANSAQEALVLGRIVGTRHELPGYFKFGHVMNTQGIEEVEFPGFKLVRLEDGKKFLTRPNRNGYFYQELPPGQYTLVRDRKDRPNHREDKTIELLALKVPPAALVNLGTLEIILDGKPREVLSPRPRSQKGVYTYTYRYFRAAGPESYDNPLNWFKDRKPHLAAGFTGKVLNVTLEPTKEPDSSRVILREYVPKSEM